MTVVMMIIFYYYCYYYMRLQNGISTGLYDKAHSLMVLLLLFLAGMTTSIQTLQRPGV